MDPVDDTMKTKEENANENIRRLLKLDGQCEVMAFYDKWEKFDEHVRSGTNAPECCFAALTRHLSGNTDISILDIGAGTGCVGELLKDHGFTNLDALDASEGMLRRAEKKQIYKRMHHCFFTDNVDCLQTNSYDAVVSAGVFGGVQVQPSALREVIRCVKPGGHVCIVTRASFVQPDTPLGQAMLMLEQEGQWRRLEESVVSNYLYSAQGTALVFKVTKS